MMLRLALQHALWWAIDLVFPVARPLTPAQRSTDDRLRTGELAECATRAAAIDDDHDRVEILKACRSVIDEEQKRQQGIDTRLTTIIGLSSIAGTVVFGTLLTVFPRTLSTLSWLLLASLAYLIIQLACAIFTAVSGLERRSYDVLLCSGLLPNSGETAKAYWSRQVTNTVEVLLQNREQNNEKLTSLAVAHRALKNFVVGLVLFATAATLHRMAEPPSDEVVSRLQTDRVLREVLRGPQGPRGLPGAQGPMGATGPPGPTGATGLPVSRPSSRH